MNSDDRDAPQLRRLQDWWLQLPLSYRLNALLYFLGACFLLFLLTSVLRGGGEPKQIQVGAGNQVTTTSTGPRATVGLPSTTSGGATSSTGPTTTGVGGTTTTRAGAGAGAGTGAGGTTATTAPAGTGTTAPPATSGATVPPTTSTPGPTLGTTPPTTTTTTAPPCRNSTDPSCGAFSWTPAPNSQRLSIAPAEVSPDPPRVNTTVTFRISVTDPDHAIGTCAFIDFGDLTSQGNCPEPPCPVRYGPWDLPAATGGPGSFTFTFTHTYTTPAPYIATFLVDNRSDCWDPYGDRQTSRIPIVVQ